MNYIKSHLVFNLYSEGGLPAAEEPRFFCSYENALAYVLHSVRCELIADGYSYEEAIEKLWAMIYTGEGVQSSGASTSCIHEGKPYSEWGIYPLPGNSNDESVFATLDSKDALVALLDKYFPGDPRPITPPRYWDADEDLLSADEILDVLRENGYTVTDRMGNQHTMAASNLLLDMSDIGGFWRIPVGDFVHNGAYIGRTKDGFLYIPFDECHDSTEGYEQLIVDEANICDTENLECIKAEIIDYCGALLNALTQAIEMTRKEVDAA